MLVWQHFRVNRVCVKPLLPLYKPSPATPPPMYFSATSRPATPLPAAVVAFDRGCSSRGDAQTTSHPAGGGAAAVGGAWATLDGSARRPGMASLHHICAGSSQNEAMSFSVLLNGVSVGRSTLCAADARKSANAPSLLATCRHTQQMQAGAADMSCRSGHVFRQRRWK